MTTTSSDDVIAHLALAAFFHLQLPMCKPSFSWHTYVRVRPLPEVSGNLLTSGICFVLR